MRGQLPDVGAELRDRPGEIECGVRGFAQLTTVEPGDQGRFVDELYTGSVQLGDRVLVATLRLAESAHRLPTPALTVLGDELADLSVGVAGCDAKGLDSALLPRDLGSDFIGFDYRLTLPRDERRRKRRAVAAFGLGKLAAQLVEAFVRLDQCGLRLRSLVLRTPDLPEAAGG
jgi:hypothetical protein